METKDKLILEARTGYVITFEGWPHEHTECTVLCTRVKWNFAILTNITGVAPANLQTLISFSRTLQSNTCNNCSQLLQNTTSNVHYIHSENGAHDLQHITMGIEKLTKCIPSVMKNTHEPTLPLWQGQPYNTCKQRSKSTLQMK